MIPIVLSVCFLFCSIPKPSNVITPSEMLASLLPLCSFSVLWIFYSPSFVCPPGCVALKFFPFVQLPLPPLLSSTEIAEAPSSCSSSSLCPESLVPLCCCTNLSPYFCRPLLQLLLRPHILSCFSLRNSDLSAHNVKQSSCCCDRQAACHDSCTAIRKTPPCIASTDTSQCPHRTGRAPSLAPDPKRVAAPQACSANGIFQTISLRHGGQNETHLVQPVILQMELHAASVWADPQYVLAQRDAEMCSKLCDCLHRCGRFMAANLHQPALEVYMSDGNPVSKMTKIKRSLDSSVVLDLVASRGNSLCGSCFFVMRLSNSGSCVGIHRK